jgi:Na+-transporting NADH:ubiquinone oxidoreductase subunit NqrB
MNDAVKTRSTAGEISLSCTLGGMVTVMFGLVAAVMIREDIITPIVSYIFPVMIFAGFVSGVIAVIRHREWIGLLVNVLLLVLILVVGTK